LSLVASRIPTHFEGEIQCLIDWESADDPNKQDMKSVNTKVNLSSYNTVSSETQELLFIRLKKRSKITKNFVGIENRDGQSLIENLLLDEVHDILESDEFDQLLERCEKKPSGLYKIHVSGDAPP